MLGSRGNVAYIHAKLSQGIHDRRRRPVHRKLAESFRSERSARIRILHHHDVYFRHIERCWNHVIGELAVCHRSVAHHDALEKSVAESLCSSAFDLSARECGMNRTTEFLNRGDLERLYFERIGIERKLDHIASPSVCRVSVTE